MKYNPRFFLQQKETRKDKNFMLEILPRDDATHGLVLCQTSLNSEQNKKKEMIVRIWGLPLKVIMDTIIKEVRSNSYEIRAINGHHKEPFILDEETGVRMGLLFMAVKPLSKWEKIERIRDSLWLMSSEEIYYWFSLCTQKKKKKSARKALRILLAEE